MKLPVALACLLLLLILGSVLAFAYGWVDFGQGWRVPTDPALYLFIVIICVYLWWLRRILREEAQDCPVSIISAETSIPEFRNS